MAMETKVMVVTPEIAQEWLTHNMACNRPVLKDTVHSYARQMRNGNWNLTHQGIAFDEAGELIDGQHRLRAIVEANIPVTINVTTGVHRVQGEAFTIDMGRKRTYANMVQMSGMVDPVYRGVGAYVSAYIRYKLPGGRKADPAEIIDYIDRHYDDVKKLYDYVGAGTHSHGVKDTSNRVQAVVGAAMLAAIYRGESAEALCKFAAVYRTNDVRNCEGYNPKYALALRDYVKRYRTNAEVYERCESSIYAFAHNLDRFRVRNNCYPLNAVLDQ